MSEIPQPSLRFSANLRRLRKAADFSQEELAFRSAIHRTQISLLEGSHRMPRVHTLICLAGALEFAMCCDIRICSDISTFAALEARFSNGIATMIMPWLIGQRARSLIYTGDTIDAQEAFRIGLVDKVYPKAGLQAEVTKFAKRMSRVSLACLQWDKRAINQTFETMGLMVYRRIAPLDLVVELAGGIVVAMWRKIGPLEERIRKEQAQPSSAEWFQWLAGQCAAHKDERLPAHLAHRDWKP